MQFSRILTYPKKARPTKIAGLAIRLVVIYIGVYYLFLNIDQQWSFLSQVGDYHVVWHLTGLLQFGLVVLLMPVNWLLEAKKWQILAKKMHLSIPMALKGVILGLSLGTIMPFGTGAVAGRLLTIDDPGRASYIPGVVLVQWLQTLVTLAFGTIGITMVIGKTDLDVLIFAHNIWPIVLLVVALVVALWFYIRSHPAGVKRYYQSIVMYSSPDWFNFTFLSIVRYLIFLTQFTLLATIFSPSIPIPMLIGCASWMFVARTIVPRLSNVETLGIRGAAAMYFCILFNLSFPGILLTIVLLWFINLLVPSLAGFFLLKEARWGKEMSSEL
jgi:hypothetical protein